MEEGRRQRGRLKTTLGVMIAVGISCIVGEVTIRTISRFVDIYDIEMHKYATRLKTRSAHPLLSHEHIPNSHAHLMGVDIKLNALGHRNRDVPETKPDSQIRIHAIGSSMCFGWGVPQEQTFTSQLERKLNARYSKARKDGRVLVINAGVGNTNTIHQVEQFKVQRHVTRPDIVILQYFINDSEVIAKTPNNVVYEYSLLLAMAKQTVSALKFSLLGPGSLAEYYTELYDDEAPGWKAVKESVKELRNLAAREDMQLVVLLIPDLHDLSQSSPFVPVYRKIVSAFGEMGIDTIDVLAELDERFGSNVKQAWVTKQDAHPNAEVHGIIAEKLMAYLTSGQESRVVSNLFDTRSPG